MSDIEFLSSDSNGDKYIIHTGGSTPKSGGDFQLAPESGVRSALLNSFMQYKDVIRFSEMYQGNFGSPKKKLRHWMKEPHLAFGGKTPRELVMSGQEAVVMRFIQGAIK